eukprot:TRINITY_DN5999_c0_g1_i5.p2 TRINITY_DN5999_c0_g1~~TRINITY_DN5999_c0_g1_i5.p2  ORF type:complete len:115 (-),score=9.28 TRINITY_DN5999_c0_g1_i5:1218-1562(-)
MQPRHQRYLTSPFHTVHFKRHMGLPWRMPKLATLNLQRKYDYNSNSKPESLIGDDTSQKEVYQNQWNSYSPSTMEDSGNVLMISTVEEAPKIEIVTLNTSVIYSDNSRYRTFCW